MELLDLEGMRTDLLAREGDIQLPRHGANQGHGDSRPGAQPGGHGNGGVDLDAQIGPGQWVKLSQQVSDQRCQRVCCGERIEVRVQADIRGLDPYAGARGSSPAAVAT